MLIPGIVLSVVGVGFFCWLLFTLAVYALPFFTGLTRPSPPSKSARVSSARLSLAFSPAAQPWRSDRSPSQRRRTPRIRAAIALLYAAPAAIAGYHAALGLALIAVPSEGCRDAFAVVGAILVGATAFARMSLFVPPTVGQRVAGPARSLLLRSAQQG